MLSRLVYVCIYQYPEDANRTLSLRRFMELSEELLCNECFFSDNDLRDLLKKYENKVIDFATLIGEPYVYRIVIRDSDGRLVKIFKA